MVARYCGKLFRKAKVFLELREVLFEVRRLVRWFFSRKASHILLGSSNALEEEHPKWLFYVFKVLLQKVHVAVLCFMYSDLV